MADISALSPNSAAQASTGARDAFSDLTSEQFVKIMFTELSNQDPLKPNDSNQMLQQLSSLRSIQSDIDLGKKLSDVVTQNQLATAGALLGKWVSGITDQNFRVVGSVDSVSRTSDGAILNLNNGYRIPFKNVDAMLSGDPTATP
jgi:flagellar basal-body rod modification protein FlgD